MGRNLAPGYTRNAPEAHRAERLHGGVHHMIIRVLKGDGTFSVLLQLRSTE
jgi:hypothetical protein